MVFNTNKEKGNSSDELFILTENVKIYIIPIEELNNKSTLNICEKYDKYRMY